MIALILQLLALWASFGLLAWVIGSCFDRDWKPYLLPLFLFFGPIVLVVLAFELAKRPSGTLSDTMGEMADLNHDRMWEDEPDPRDDDAAAIFEDMTPIQLVEATALLNDPKVKGIRAHFVQHGWLSDRQRWCLAFSIANDEANLSL